jgi:hypothetical protein
VVEGHYVFPGVRLGGDVDSLIVVGESVDDLNPRGYLIKRGGLDEVVDLLVQ